MSGGSAMRGVRKILALGLTLAVKVVMLSLILRHYLLVSEMTIDAIKTGAQYGSPVSLQLPIIPWFEVAGLILAAAGGATGYFWSNYKSKEAYAREITARNGSTSDE